MDLNSYIQLKEAYTQVGKPQQLTESVDSIWEEVEAFAHHLVEEEGLDLSDMTWDEVREAYLLEFEDTDWAKKETKPKPASRNNYAGGVVGQFQRLGDKMSGNQSRVNKARSYEISKNELRTKNVNAGGNASDKIDQAAINKRTTERRKADPNYKAGQGVDSGSKPANKPNNGGGGNGGGGNGGGGNGGGGGGGNSTAKTQPAAPAKDRMAKASKADRMGAWAKANPKLAAAQKQRASTRGTSATTNPLMKDLKSRMPKPAAPNKPSGGGLSAVKPQSFKSSVAAGSAMKSAASKPTPKPTPKPTASVTGNKASSFMNKSASNALSKPMKEESDFDIILAHLIEQGFGDDEALILMVNMSEEKREEILQISEKINLKDQSSQRKSLGRGSSINPDSKPTGYESPNEFRNAEKKYAKQKTRKEEDESLYQAYLSMMSEEGCDARKDKELEIGGHAARTDHSKPPSNSNTKGKKNPLSDEERSAAMAKVVAKLKKQGGN